MLRRDLFRGAALGAAAAAGASLPRFAIAQPANSRVLRFVPQSDVTIIDPFLTTAYVTRNHALLIFDQLYGLDLQLRPQPQMVEGHTVEQDGRLYRFRLREGLTFHDNTPVLGRDCIASVKRWAARDSLGQALLQRLDAMEAPSDREFTIRLKKPFPLLLQALAKLGPPACCIMPERLANTDPYKAITEMVGSGPFRWVADERVPGARAVYAKFDGYKPRPDGAIDQSAGPKIAHFDRIEWQVMPDPGTAAAALQNGEVTWWENPPNDLLPVLGGGSDMVLENANPLGTVGTGVFNHLHPPFDKAAVRRVVLEAATQSDFLNAAAGSDPSMWKDGMGVFTPGTPMSNDAELNILMGKRDIKKSREALKAAGYNGERVVLMAPSDQPVLSALGEVANDLLKQLGMNVEYVVTDWGSVVQRRAKRDAPDKGGWNMFFTTWRGLDMADPAVTQVLRANGSGAWFGWPDLPKLEGLRQSWLDAPEEATQKDLARQIQAEALQQGMFLPTGQQFDRTAYRKGLTGVLKGGFFFWNVKRG